MTPGLYQWCCCGGGAVNVFVAYYNAGGNITVAEYHAGFGYWTLEFIDLDYGVSDDPCISLAVDSEGNPHVAYWAYDSTYHNKPIYAYRPGSGDVEWVTEDLRAVGSSSYPSGISLVLDSTDMPHVALCLSTDYAGVLQYSVKSGGVWTHKFASDNCLFWTHLALYTDTSPFILTTWMEPGGSWRTRPKRWKLVAGTLTGLFLEGYSAVGTLATCLASDGTAHCLMQYGSPAVPLHRFAVTSADVITIDHVSTDDVGIGLYDSPSQMGIRALPGGVIHAVYLDAACNVRHAIFDSSWTVSTVDNAGGNFGVAIEVDPTGAVFIAHIIQNGADYDLHIDGSAIPAMPNTAMNPIPWIAFAFKGGRGPNQETP